MNGINTCWDRIRNQHLIQLSIIKQKNWNANAFNKQSPNHNATDVRNVIKKS